MLIHMFAGRSRTQLSPAPRARAVAALALLALALVSSCSSKDNSTAPAPNTSVSFNYAFLAPGQSIQRTFTTVGSFAYHCAAHQGSGMTGTVVVSASASLDSQVVLVGHNDNLTFSPSTATIKPNGTIRWVRETGASGTSLNNHTATRP
jgi:plastocyanin